MTHKERTYDNPGDCIKCGHGETHSLLWTEVARRPSGESIGYMEATCLRCGYKWEVTAKDNMTEQERTYDCPKCGDKGTPIQWKEPWLGAACNRCGIKWPVNAKDES